MAPQSMHADTRIKMESLCNQGVNQDKPRILVKSRLAEPTMGIFGLPHEILHLILVEILRCPSGTATTASREVASTGRRSVLALTLTCRILYKRVFGNGDPKIAAELHARVAAVATPHLVEPTSFGFTEQAEKELSTAALLKAYKKAHSSMALHCSRQCCLHIQRAFNRDAKCRSPALRNRSPLAPRALSPSLQLPALSMPIPAKPSPVPGSPRERPRIWSALETCALLAPAPDGTTAFAYRRRRLSKLGVHGEARARRYSDEIVRLQLDADRKPRITDSFCLHEFTDYSQPILLAASSCGSMVAWVSTNHDDTPGDAITTAFTWKSGWKEAIELSAGSIEHPARSAQSVHFHGERLVVAFSTCFVHPSGHLVGTKAAGGQSAYSFATFEISDDRVELSSRSELHENGRLLSCSASRTEVLALVRRQGVAGSNHRVCILHDLESDRASRVPFTVPSQRGVLAAALSPSADAIVALHRSERAFVLSLLLRISDTAFLPAQKLDISHLLGLSVNEHPSSWTSQSLVKAAFSVGFSSCGRFAFALDNRPAYGEAAAACGLVLVDTRARDVPHRMKATGLFPSEEQAPRSVAFCGGALWTMPPGTDAAGSIGARGGALVLC